MASIDVLSAAVGGDLEVQNFGQDQDTPEVTDVSPEADHDVNLPDAPLRAFGNPRDDQRLAPSHSPAFHTPRPRRPNTRSRRSMNLLATATLNARANFLQAEEEEEDEDSGRDTPQDMEEGNTRPSTPPNFFLSADEPSSVLASRIMRAHDNPSPPPRLHRTVDSAPQSPLSDLTPEDTPARTPLPPLLVDVSGYFPEMMTVDAPAAAHASPTPVPAYLAGADDSQPDLISFDSPAARGLQYLQVDNQIQPGSAVDEMTVDDLLSRDSSPSSSVETPGDEVVVDAARSPALPFADAAIPEDDAVTVSDNDMVQDPELLVLVDGELEEQGTAGGDVPVLQVENPVELVSPQAPRSSQQESIHDAEEAHVPALGDSADLVQRGGTPNAAQEPESTRVLDEARLATPQPRRSARLSLSPRPVEPPTNENEAKTTDSRPEGQTEAGPSTGDNASPHPRRSARISGTPRILFLPSPNKPSSARRYSSPRRDIPNSAQHSSPLKALDTINDSETPAEHVSEKAQGKKRAIPPSDSPVRQTVVVPLPEVTPLRLKSRKKAHASLGDRALGSLSPNSSGLLSSLLPSVRGPDDGSPVALFKRAQSNLVSSFDNSQDNPEAAHYPEHTQPSPSAQDPSTTANPFLTTSRPPTTPLKFGASRPNDPSRSPAKRIPLDDAVAQGAISPQKAAELRQAKVGLFGSAVFTARANAGPTTPARRITIEEAKERHRAFGSPGKPASARAASADPQPRLVIPETPVRGKGRAASEQPTEQAQARTRAIRFHNLHPPPPDGDATDLPFPISPSPAKRVLAPAMIPEEPEEPSSPIAAGAPREPTPPGPSGTAESGKHSPAPLASRPAKGTLRQPSPAKESRIPRIGAKPYARPTAASGRTTKESKITTPASAPPAGKSKPAPSVVRKTARIVRVISRARTPSDDSSDKSGSGVPAAQTTAAPPRTTAVRQGRFAKPTTVAPASAPVGSLKRKREPGPPSPPPVVVARMVRPGTFTHPKTGPPKSEPPAASKRIPEVTIISPPVRTIPRPRSAAGATVSKRRTKVADPDSEIAPTAPTKAIKPQTEASVDIPPPETVAEDAATAREVVPPPVDDTEPSKVASPPAQQEQSEEPEPSSRGRRTRARSNSVTADAQQSDAQESDVEGASETRRTRRSRKPTQANDVFGPRVVSLQPKRKEPRDRSAPPNAGIFWGMTATALRALTNSNTSKNERYYATLKTEIVRKEGERPASPVMKAKTISQRQQEEKERGRQERAARRARRSEGSVAETEASSQDWDEGNVDADDLEDVPGKHRRGAGDEEDYETPHRTQQALRQGAGETEDEGKPKKRVKWDRGLFTTVCLDEVLPKPKKPQKEDLTKRGCLTPKAKTLRLDSLGNVLNTDMPLSLVPENIVVKKFIYDNDEGAEPPPEPKTPATRSKKAKT